MLHMTSAFGPQARLTIRTDRSTDRTKRHTVFCGGNKMHRKQG